MRWFLASGLFLAAHVSSGRGFSLSRSSLSYLNQLLTQRITPTDDRLQRRAFAGNLRGN